MNRIKSNYKSIIGCLFITVLSFLLLYVVSKYIVKGDNNVYFRMVLNLLVLPMICFLCSIVLGCNFKIISVLYTAFVVYIGLSVNKALGFDINYLILVVHIGVSSFAGIAFGMHLCNNKNNMMEDGEIKEFLYAEYNKN